MEADDQNTEPSQNDDSRDKIFLNKSCDSDKKLLNLIAEIIIKIILEEE